MALSITTFGTKALLYQFTQKTLYRRFLIFSPRRSGTTNFKKGKASVRTNEWNYNIYQVLSQAIPQPSAPTNANEARPTNNHNFNNREQRNGHRGEKQVIKQCHRAKLEYQSSGIKSYSKGAIRPTPHTEWTVKGISYRKRRPEHKSEICMSIFQQNCRKANLKSQPYFNIKMPSYFVKNGLKQPTDDDLFGLMSSLLEREQARSLSSSSSTSSEEEPTTSWRVRDDRTYDNRPNDPDYFKTYYQRRVKQPVECKYCGMMISDKSNLSKHSKTKRCMGNRSSKNAIIIKIWMIINQFDIEKCP